MRGSALAARAARLSNAEPFEARQHLVADERKLGEVVDEVEAQTGKPGVADRSELTRDVIRYFRSTANRHSREAKRRRFFS